MGKIITKLPPTKDKRCGTYAGYRAHQLRKETACLGCKSASREFHRLYRANSPSIIQKKDIKWRKNNHEKIKVQSDRWRKDNPEIAKRWATNNPERMKDLHKLWDKNNPEKSILRVTTWRKNNPEKCRDMMKAWRKANPEKAKEISRKSKRKYRALKIGNGHSPYTEKQVLEKYGTGCYLCGLPIDMKAPRQVGKKGWQKGLHIEHLIAINNDGRDDLENTRPSHGLCNLQKSDKIFIHAVDDNPSIIKLWEENGIPTTTVEGWVQ